MADILDYIDKMQQMYGDKEPSSMVPEPRRTGFKSGGSYDYGSMQYKIDSVKAAYKRYKKGSQTGGRGGKMTFEQFAPIWAKENFADGGSAGQLVQPNDDGSRPGYAGKDAATFTSGTGTGKKGIDDPKKYKIVKKYLNKVKSQKNKRIFLDWSEQIDGKKTKWYTDLSKEVQLSRDPLNKLINKVTLEEFPTAYAGKSGRVNHAREMVVKSFIDYWNQNGAFDGNEKLSNVLKQFQKDSVDKRFENINRYFMDWKESKFEVPGVDRKNLDKNLLKDIKNYKPNAKDVRSLTVAKQLKYLDGLNPKYSFDTVEKLFAKQFPDNAQTLQHRLNQLTQLKRNGAYNTGAGNVQKIATIKIGDRPKWLIEGYGKGFKGNYGNLIKKADDLLAAGDKVNAERLYKAADKFFSPNGIFTKAAGEGEHPLSRNMGDGPIGNQLKINSLVSGDLNQFKKFNFDSPVRNAVLEYNNPKTTDARRTDLKIEIENRKKLMNILTEGPNQKGIVDSVKFNYGNKKINASVDVVDIDKVKNFDINEYITRGEDYRKSFVAKGENLGLIDKSGNIIKQKINKKTSRALQSFFKKNGIKCNLANGINCGQPEAYVKSINELKAKAAAGDKAAAKKLVEVTKGMSKGGKLLRSLIGPGAILFEPVYEGVVAANKVLDGKPLNQAWAESYLSYLDSERVDPKTLEREEMLYRQIEGPERKVKGGQGTVTDKINIDAGGASKLRPLFAAEDTMAAFEKAKKEKRRGEFISRKDIENKAAADIRDMRKTGSINFAQQTINDPATQEALSKAQEYIAAKRGAASSIPQSAMADERRRREAMKADGMLTIEDAKNELQGMGDYYGQGYTPFGLNKLFEEAGMQNPGYGITKVGPATGKYNQAQGLQDYLNSMRMQTIADAGGVANMAGGGIAGLSGGDKSGRPPESGPASQGLRSLYKNGRKL